MAVALPEIFLKYIKVATVYHSGDFLVVCLKKLNLACVFTQEESFRNL